MTGAALELGLGKGKIAEIDSGLELDAGTTKLVDVTTAADEERDVDVGTTTGGRLVDVKRTELEANALLLLTPAIGRIRIAARSDVPGAKSMACPAYAVLRLQKPYPEVAPSNVKAEHPSVVSQIVKQSIYPLVAYTGARSWP